MKLQSRVKPSKEDEEEILELPDQEDGTDSASSEASEKSTVAQDLEGLTEEVYSIFEVDISTIVALLTMSQVRV